MAELLDIDVRGLTADSRTVEPGFLFAALPGLRTDGRAYIDYLGVDQDDKYFTPKGLARGGVR